VGRGQLAARATSEVALGAQEAAQAAPEPKVRGR